MEYEINIHYSVQKMLSKATLTHIICQSSILLSHLPAYRFQHSYHGELQVFFSVPSLVQ